MIVVSTKLLEVLEGFKSFPNFNLYAQVVFTEVMANRGFFIICPKDHKGENQRIRLSFGSMDVRSECQVWEFEFSLKGWSGAK